MHEKHIFVTFCFLILFEIVNYDDVSEKWCNISISFDFYVLIWKYTFHSETTEIKFL